MWAESADCNSRASQHCPATSALAGSGSIRELQSHRIAYSRVVGVTKTVRTVDSVGIVTHEIVNLDRIPLHRPDMRHLDEHVETIQYFRSDGVVHEMFTVFGDRISEIRTQREEKADRIRRIRRHHDAFPGFASFLSQL